MTTTSIQEATVTMIQQSALRWRRRRGWRVTKRVMASRAMTTIHQPPLRRQRRRSLAGDKECDSGKSDGNDKRVEGEQRRQRRQRGGRRRRRRGRRVTKRAMERAARAMATATKRAMARMRVRAKAARAMAMARKMGRAARAMATATKRARARKRARRRVRAFVLSSVHQKLFVLSQCKKSVPISGPSQITNHKFATATHKRKEIWECSSIVDMRETDPNNFVDAQRYHTNSYHTQVKNRLFPTIPQELFS